MKKNLFKIGLFSMAFAALTLGSCSNDDNNNDDSGNSGDDGKRWISITGSFPDETGRAGDGGTRAYAISEENAEDPNYVVDLFKMENQKYVNGFGLKSERTARVQASADGKYLYNIQYVGTEGGTFNKYEVNGEGSYKEVGNEINTASVLSTAPRWVKAAEGIGVGVYASALDIEYEGTAPNFVFKKRESEIKIATINLDDTYIANTAVFNFPFTDAEKAAGYYVGRIDVPVLNAAKDRIYIGCNVSKYNPNGTITINNSGIPSWPSDNGNIDGTKTLVVDYPSLRNPRVLTSTLTKVNNHGYRTMTQYVGTDGHVYQATATSGADILRISKTTYNYDADYHFNLNTALKITGAQIRAWRYVKDGIAVVLYTISGTNGGYIALINLNDKTATKLDTEIETNAGLNTTLGQYQNIGVIGDKVYIPLSPAGADGNIYIIDTKAKSIAKGAQLKTASGSFYLGAY